MSVGSYTCKRATTLVRKAEILCHHISLPSAQPPESSSKKVRRRTECGEEEFLGDVTYSEW